MRPFQTAARACLVLALMLAPHSARGQTQLANCEPYVLTGAILECAAAGSLRAQLRSGTFIAGSIATGESLSQAIGLEVATAPFGSSSGGFTFTFDSSRRVWNRTASTFGPAFSERALTMGKGKISVALNILGRKYDSLDGFGLESIRVIQFRGGALPASVSTLELDLRTDTLAGGVHYGVLDNLDVGVIVPYVRVDATGTSRLFAENGQELQRVGLRAANSGVGDVAFSGKYRFADFGPPPAAGDTWNASLAAALVVRFPTGDPDDLLGLGVARVLPTFIASGTIGRVSPHLNLGYEFWSDAIETPHDFQERTATVSIKDQVYYSAGFEYELHPRLTVLADVLGRYLRGGGRVGYQPYFFPSNRLDVAGADALVSIPSGFHTVTLAPGVKWNVYGAALLAAHVLIAATDGGLRDRVTPVIGIDWGF